MNTENFITRLKEIMMHYELSAASLADSLQVQRSSISHLINGRNKPSLEFILKVVDIYPEVNLYWLLLGIGSFPQDLDYKSLAVEKNQKENTTTNTLTSNYPTPSPNTKSIERIVIFYNDGTFSTFNQS